VHNLLHAMLLENLQRRPEQRVAAMSVGDDANFHMITITVEVRFELYRSLPLLLLPLRIVEWPAFF
jgi:hypothetical protein